MLTTLTSKKQKIDYETLILSKYLKVNDKDP
jgi:hypothetical protein